MHVLYGIIGAQGGILRFPLWRKFLRGLPPSAIENLAYLFSFSLLSPFCIFSFNFPGLPSFEKKFGTFSSLISILPPTAT